MVMMHVKAGAVSLALLVSSLLGLSACDQGTVAPNAEPDAPNFAAMGHQSDSVATPAGWYHKSCVHEIPNGARVSASGLVKRRDGTTFQVPACSHPRPLNRANFGRSNSATFPTNNGWMEYAYYQLTSGNSFHQLNAGWRVPPAPTGSYGGTDLYYSFPGLDSIGSRTWHRP
jgi:hypothetical protein